MEAPTPCTCSWHMMWFCAADGRASWPGARCKGAAGVNHEGARGAHWPAESSRSAPTPHGCLVEHGHSCSRILFREGERPSQSPKRIHWVLAVCAMTRRSQSWKKLYLHRKRIHQWAQNIWRSHLCPLLNVPCLDRFALQSFSTSCARQMACTSACKPGPACDIPFFESGCKGGGAALRGLSWTWPPSGRVPRGRAGCRAGRCGA